MAPGTQSTTAETASPSYGTRLADVSKWAVGGLAAVAGAAVTKLSLDRLGKGDLDTTDIALAYVGLTLFALGAVALVIAVVWQTRSERVTLGYLLGSSHVPTKIREFLEQNAYLLGGEPNLLAFRTRLIHLVRAARPLSNPDRLELRRLIAAREAILSTGRSERARIVSFWAGWLMLIGAVAATLGAATFALATNHDVVLREDRLSKEQKTVAAGELLPKTPSSVLLVAPAKGLGRDALQTLVGKSCPLGGAKAILLEVAVAPTSAQRFGDKLSAFHVVTEPGANCSFADFWVPATWVVPRPVEAATTTAAATTTESTTTQPAP